MRSLYLALSVDTVVYAYGERKEFIPHSSNGKIQISIALQIMSFYEIRLCVGLGYFDLLLMN